MGYLEISVESFKPLGDRILIEWDEKNDEFKGTGLIRPDTHKSQHYTGVVLKVGPFVTEEIKPGIRLLFSQFSGFEKLFDPQYGRLALVSESKQDSPFAIVPPRVKIQSDQGDYDYNA